MEIIEDWTIIQCPWCHKIINFVEYHYRRQPEITGIELTPDRILQWEIDLSTEALEPLYNKFIAVRSKLLNQELQVFVPRPEARLHKDGYCHILIHSPDCYDYFTLNIANTFNDRLVEQKTL